MRSKVRKVDIFAFVLEMFAFVLELSLENGYIMAKNYHGFLTMKTTFLKSIPVNSTLKHIETLMSLIP